MGAASGSTICGLYDVTPTRFGQVSNKVQPSANFGKQTDRYHGFDIGLNARFGRGGLLTGGVSTGKTVTDNCSVVQDNWRKRSSILGARLVKLGAQLDF